MGLCRFLDSNVGGFPEKDPKGKAEVSHGISRPPYLPFPSASRAFCVLPRLTLTTPTLSPCKGLCDFCARVRVLKGFVVSWRFLACMFLKVLCLLFFCWWSHIWD